MIALGKEKTGDEAFYASLTDEVQNPPTLKHTDLKDGEGLSDDNGVEENDGKENLETMMDLFKEQDELKQDVIDLGTAFIKDVEERIQKLDLQYLTGLKKFFTVYMDTIDKTEPATSATPKLSSLLHTYFSKSSSIAHVAGSRHMHVQPTAISRRREGVTRGNQMAPSGRPRKRLNDEADCNVQHKRGRAEHTKRKQNLKLNETKNQANHFKHGRGH